MKILVIKPSSLGDIIHSLPFLKAVKDSFKDASVDWVVSKGLAGILEGHPMINRLIVFDKDSWKDIKNLPKTIKDVKELVKDLRTDEYDIVADLQGLLRSGLMTFFARSPVKIGFDNAREGSRLFYGRKVRVSISQHAVDRYLDMAKDMGAAVGEIKFPLATGRSAIEKATSLTDGLGGYIVIVPSARWQTKQWPAENFGDLISKMPVKCVIAGSNTDRQIVKKVLAASMGKGIDLSGRTGLKELSALISGAKAVISNDSGPMHIAAALDIPVIALFGPTDPDRTGPYGWRHNNDLKVLRSSLQCIPCFKRKCDDPATTSGSPACMSGIKVEAVFEAVKEYL